MLKIIFFIYFDIFELSTIQGELSKNRKKKLVKKMILELYFDTSFFELRKNSTQL